MVIGNKKFLMCFEFANDGMQEGMQNEKTICVYITANRNFSLWSFIITINEKYEKVISACKQIYEKCEIDICMFHINNISISLTFRQMEKTAK